MKRMLPVIALIVFLTVAVYIFNLKASSDDEIKSNYEVITDSEVIHNLNISRSETRKYEELEVEGEHYIIVYYGECPHYFNTLDVTNVKITGSKITIDVKLPTGEGVGDAFSYPYAVIKVDKKFERIVVNYK